MGRMPLLLVLSVVLAAGCSLLETDQDRDGVPEGEDCNDNDAQIRPGINEICDGIDNDCNDLIDDGVLIPFYRDADGDGYGDPAFSVEECDEPDGFSVDPGDCDDDDREINPDAVEVCDGVDNDCDGDEDEEGALEEPTWYLDADGDGWGGIATEAIACTAPDGFVAENTDCDDADANVHPEADELCNDVDDDCDGSVDEDPVEGEQAYEDFDADGYGNPDAPVFRCEITPGYSLDSTDCDDSSASVYPGADEHCNGVDDDCDEVPDNDPVDGAVFFEDADGDGHGSPDVFENACDSPPGYVAIGDDCDDGAADVFPGAPEVCDGQDNDCDPGNDEETDIDGDGFSLCAGDCDDTDLSVGPDAVEVCDGFDDDCNGLVDDACVVCDLWVPGDFPSIQDAIDASSNGQVICVDEGTYDEILDFGGRDVEVLGLAGPEWTVIDANHTGSVVTFDSGEGIGAVLRGFSLVNGASQYGAGIRVDGATPTLEQLVVRDCQANVNGGGIAVSNATLNLTDTTVQACYAFAGSGGGIHVEASNAVLSGLQLRYNSAGSHGGGLAVVSASGAIEVRDSSFVGNAAYEGGGGMYETDAGVYTVLHNVLVSGNLASLQGGGGLSFDDAYPILEVVSIVANAAPFGGGLYTSACTTTLDNVIVQGNSGGGVEMRGAAGSPSLTHVSVVGNDAAVVGGGVLLVDTSPIFVNVDISENTAPAGGGVRAINAAPLFSHCNVWGNDPDNYLGVADPTGTSGNLSLDPGYLDSSPADPADWDIHLWAGSPLVNAGDSNLLDPDGSVSDIGALGGGYADQWDLDGDGFPGWWQPGDYDFGVYPGQGWDCDDLDPTTYPGKGC